MALILAAITVCSMCVFAEDIHMNAEDLFVSTSDAPSQDESMAQTPETETTDSSSEKTETVTTGSTSDATGAVTTESATTDGATETVQPELPKIEFSDVPETAPYYEAVKKLVENGVLKGYEDGTFRPENGVTRAEMCKMINLTLGIVDITDAKGFSDVAENNWFYLYALAAQKNGYVVGYEDGTFRGSNLITREEVCTILNRILKPMDLGIPVNITDKVSGWAKPHVDVIVMNMLMPLEENNTFRATEVIKRHELSSVLSNLVIGPVKEIVGEVRFFVGETQYGETQTVPVGSCATVPEEPVSQDETMKFDGWKVKGTEDVIDVMSTVITESVDYEAVFIKKTYTVNFYTKGVLHETCTVEHSAFASVKSEPSESGYKFKGWALAENGAVIDLKTTAITEDKNFYAVFEKTESTGGGGGGPAGGGGGPSGGDKKEYFTVNFYVDGKEYHGKKVLKGESINLPDDPEVDGKVFLGWAKVEDGDASDVVNFAGIKVTEEMEFYAVLEDELIHLLKKGQTEIKKLRVSGYAKEARDLVVKTITSLLSDAEDGAEIDTDYVLDNYSEDVKMVKAYINDDEYMTSTERSNFLNNIKNNVSQDVRDFLIEYFEIDTDI